MGTMDEASGFAQGRWWGLGAKVRQKRIDARREVCYNVVVPERGSLCMAVSSNPFFGYPAIALVAHRQRAVVGIPEGSQIGSGVAGKSGGSGYLGFGIGNPV